MSNNSPNLKKDDHSGVRFTGTITELSETKGKLICENFFGPVFIPRLADSQRRKLTDVYKIGDRVSFFAAPAKSPDKPCKYVAVNLDLEASIDLMQNVSAKVGYIEPTFGFLQIPQLSTRAYFRIEDVTEPCADLTTRYPFQSRVMCELELQNPHNGCIYRARNVRRLRPVSFILSSPSLRTSTRDSNSSSIIQDADSPNPDLSRDENSTSTDNEDICSNEEEDFFNETEPEVESEEAPPVAEDDLVSRVSVACQTDKMLELHAIQSILAKENVFQLLCTECPNALQTLIHCQLRF